MGEKAVVAFLGPRATYTHQTQYDNRPQTTIEDVLAAVQSGVASHGVVPFENSTNGSVIITLDLFADVNDRYPDILVDGEVYLAVQHCLLGHVHTTSSNGSPGPQRTGLAWQKSKNEDADSTAPKAVMSTRETPSPAQVRVKPNYNLQHLTKLYSHPQAWGQCKLFLDTYLKGIERQDVSSTSKAAEIVANDKTGSSAAISSRIAADLNSLDILAEGIEDNEGNSTRFFILRHRDSLPLQPATAPPTDEDEEKERYKSLVTFTVSHDSPGALADSLAVFKKYKLNLTNFTSRPSGEAPWHYIFFVEFYGRKRGEEEAGAVNAALLELGQVAQTWRWLGSWENRLMAR